VKPEIRFEQFKRVAVPHCEVVAHGFGNPGGVAVENFAHQMLISARQIVRDGFRITQNLISANACVFWMASRSASQRAHSAIR
jgi:hypothetical protein